MKMDNFKDYPDRPACKICGKPCDMDNKYDSGKVKWRDMCYTCHDHRTDQDYIADNFVGSTLPISDVESYARFN
jgi:hypothetical protein